MTDICCDACGKPSKSKGGNAAKQGTALTLQQVNTQDKSNPLHWAFTTVNAHAVGLPVSASSNGGIDSNAKFNLYLVSFSGQEFQSLTTAFLRDTEAPLWVHTKCRNRAAVLQYHALSCSPHPAGLRYLSEAAIKHLTRQQFQERQHVDQRVDALATVLAAFKPAPGITLATSLIQEPDKENREVRPRPTLASAAAPGVLKPRAQPPSITCSQSLTVTPLLVAVAVRQNGTLPGCSH